jgi:NAD-dependent dihydropyrimidine dehydrogenase PreA subunit
MTYIVCEPCIGTKDRACVEVCPVECFYEGTDQLYIHPEECIDCAACEPVCPVTAIFPEDSVPEQWKDYTPKNYKFIEQYPQAPHALTKAMQGDQDNFAHTFTVEGKTITLPPPPAGFGGPAAPAPKEAAPAEPKAEAPPKAAAAPAPKTEAAPKAAAPVPQASRTATAAPDAITQIAEAAAAAAEAAARAAEAAAAASRLLQGKADGRTASGAPSAPTGQPQSPVAAKPAEAKAAPRPEAPAATPSKAGPDPSFERAKAVLYALIDFESGARRADPDELARAEETATALFDEIGKAVGKRDYTLQDLEKDVTLRQKMEFGNAIVDRVARTRLQMEIERQRKRTRAQVPGAVLSFAIAGVCAALGLLYALRYSLPPAATPTLNDLLTAPFSPEGFMPFLGFNLLAGFFGLFGALALFKVARSWVEACQLEALHPKEFGAASLRPRRLSWVYRLKIESQRILEAQRMLQALTAKKR